MSPGSQTSPSPPPARAAPGRSHRRVRRAVPSRGSHPGGPIPGSHAPAPLTRVAEQSQQQRQERGGAGAHLRLRPLPGIQRRVPGGGGGRKPTPFGGGGTAGGAAPRREEMPLAAGAVPAAGGRQQLPATGGGVRPPPPAGGAVPQFPHSAVRGITSGGPRTPWGTDGGAQALGVGVPRDPPGLAVGSSGTQGFGSAQVGCVPPPNVHCCSTAQPAQRGGAVPQRWGQGQLQAIGMGTGAAPGDRDRGCPIAPQHSATLPLASTPSGSPCPRLVTAPWPWMPTPGQ